MARSTNQYPGNNPSDRARIRFRRHACRVLAAAAAVLLVIAGPASAQSLQDLISGSGNLTGSPDSAPQTTVTVTLTLADGVTAESAAAGAEVVLAIRVAMPAGAYTYSQNPSFGGATRIVVSEVYGLEPLDEAFTPDHEPKVVFEEGFGQNVEKFTGEVTWTRRFRLSGAVPADQVSLGGQIKFQVCDAQSCTPLTEAFEVLVETNAPAAAAIASAAPQAESSVPVPAPEISAAPAVDDILDFQLQADADQASLGWYLLMAFLGGLILNVMPCVLPVLAIKVMSFVQQSGESRARVLLLNLSYSLGVIGVFLVLATLAVTLQFGWGGLFTKPEFILVMTAVVFAMGLSLLGVFEIPIPGMVGSAGGQHREGLTGAFVTGIFATLLATPCTGPFMGSTLAWSVKQSPLVVFLVWGVMGLGMASPYLMVGVFPHTVRFLPRPGMWMVRFKEFAGFTLMAATVWLLSTMPQPTVIPALIILLGIAIAVWMVGTLYDQSSSFLRKSTVRGVALTVLVALGWYGSAEYRAARSAAGEPAAIARADGELPWQPFSEERLRELVASNTPVLIDFTADWCQICKFNEHIALNTPATSAFVERHGVVPLIADWTEEDPVITKWLDRFGRIGVPLYVIIPPGKPEQSILLDGQLSQSQVLQALEQAVSPEVAADAVSASVR
ncbi:MAG: cytochrome c biogenesis protein CcdA [Planctomycetaceae bacterium]